MQLCKVLVLSIFVHFYKKASFFSCTKYIFEESNQILKNLKMRFEPPTSAIGAVQVSIELVTHFPKGFVCIYTNLHSWTFIFLYCTKLNYQLYSLYCCYLYMLFLFYDQDYLKSILQQVFQF